MSVDDVANKTPYSPAGELTKYPSEPEKSVIISLSAEEAPCANASGVSTDISNVPFLISSLDRILEKFTK